MTTAERKSIELENLIAAHRVVRVQYTETEHFTVTAQVDMPEWRVNAGETVHLYASSFPGYYYIIAWDSDWNRHACRCKSHEFAHHCKHGDKINEICKERYHHIRAIQEVQQAKRELATEKVPVPARQYEDWSSADAPIYTSDRPAVTIPDDDMAAHIQDSIESGELDWIDEQRAAWANATPDERRAMYCDDFGIYDYASYGAA